MDSAERQPTIRLPSEPYPGLRPFLDHEAALLFGRHRQVVDVIERLRQTQFVAVIGGSGSGKSSLIHAGVVPELRSFGIPDAGDFWIPMVCTPGTNFSEEERRSRAHTPITRLAWKFSKLLVPCRPPQDEAARIREIADVFRQEAGFKRLMDTYAADLKVVPGLAPTDARLLFVIDQFEELFHATNKDSEECRLLIERVIDHFFDPHKRCYVVLTMRSEQLSDCAAYLELPDAINKSSYLVRRLDDDELREAIEGPAQRYLRLLARQAADPTAIPEAVHFDDKVLERVLRDVRTITSDPDHLPLLQHLLARVWQTARARCGQAAPADIRWSDLDFAVRAAEATVPLDDKTNVLRASLENWAETLYCQYTKEERDRFDMVLRQLALKDPNSGQYTQQRLTVDECARFLGDGATREQLHALVSKGFIGSANYLFWDDEDPKRVTLKVSHESFIRGWTHFRHLIDTEAERFEEFVAVLRKCAAWLAKGRRSDLLLEAGDLRRLHDAKLEGVLASPVERTAWFRLLLNDRDGARLAQCEHQVDDFIRRSNEKQDQLRLSRKRSRVALWAAVVTAVAIAPYALFSVLIQNPVTRRAQLYFDANSRADQARISDNFAYVGAAVEPLSSLLEAADSVKRGRSGDAGWSAKLSEYLMTHWAWLPGIERQREFLSRVAQQAEPRVNGELRKLLSGAVWTTAGKPDRTDAFDSPTFADDAKCTVYDAQTRAETVRTGRLFRSPPTPDTPSARAVFVPADSDAPELLIRAASIDAKTKACTSRDIVIPIPRFLGPRVAMDANLRYLLVSTDEPKVVTVYEMNWERNEDGKNWGAQRPRRVTVITDQKAGDLIRTEIPKTDVNTVSTWRIAGGRALGVGDQYWRVVSLSAQRLKAATSDFTELAPSKAGSPCELLNAQLHYEEAGFQSTTKTMYENREGHEQCFLVRRGNPPSKQPNEAPLSKPADQAVTPAPDPGVVREEVLVAVFERPSLTVMKTKNFMPPAPIASIPFGRYERNQNRWYVGKTSGAYDGWIALLRPTAGGKEYLFGTPWSTEALLALGNEIKKEQPKPLKSQIVQTSQP